MSSHNRIANVIIRSFDTRCSGFLKSAASVPPWQGLKQAAQKQPLGVNYSPENGFEVIQSRGLKVVFQGLSQLIQSHLKLLNILAFKHLAKQGAQHIRVLNFLNVLGNMYRQYVKPVNDGVYEEFPGI
jgi:hypothetical protein